MRESPNVFRISRNSIQRVFFPCTSPLTTTENVSMNYAHLVIWRYGIFSGARALISVTGATEACLILLETHVTLTDVS